MPEQHLHDFESADIIVLQGRWKEVIVVIGELYDRTDVTDRLGRAAARADADRRVSPMPEPAASTSHVSERTALLEGLGPGTAIGSAATGAQPVRSSAGSSATIAVHLARCWAPQESPPDRPLRPDPARSP